MNGTLLRRGTGGCIPIHWHNPASKRIAPRLVWMVTFVRRRWRLLRFVLSFFRTFETIQKLSIDGHYRAVSCVFEYNFLWQRGVEWVVNRLTPMCSCEMRLNLWSSVKLGGAALADGDPGLAPKESFHWLFPILAGGSFSRGAETDRLRR